MKKWLACLLAFCLLLTMAVPAALAEGETENTVAYLKPSGIDWTASANVSSGKVKTSSGQFGEFFDDMHQGHVLCLARGIDLTDLASIDLSVSHTGSGVVYGFYIDGTKGELGPRIAQVTGQSTGGWQNFREFTAAFSDLPTMYRQGTHDLYMIVDQKLTGSDYCGNWDYVKLTYAPAEEEQSDILEFEDVYVANRSSVSRNIVDEENASGGQFVDNTFVNDVFYLGEYDMTGLDGIDFTVGFSGSWVKYAFYVDGTKSAPGQKIAEITANDTGGWRSFKTFSATVDSNLPAGTLQGTHTLFMKIDSASGSNGGNLDCLRLSVPQVENGRIYTSTTKRFAAYNVKTGNGWDDPIGNTNSDRTVLGYNNVSFDGLKTVALNYAPGGATAVNLYKGDPDDGGELFASFTFDKTKINSGNWYESDNYRTTYCQLPDHGLTGTDALYFELLKVSEYAGNLAYFTLYYEKEVASFVDVATVEGEDYVWGVGALSETWDNSSAGYLDHTYDGDVFYLGKADLSDLQAITVRTATADGGITYTFYADMDVDYAAISAKQANQDRYQPISAVSGGTELTSMAVSPTNGPASNWTTFTYFTGAVSQQTRDALDAGEHAIYLKLTHPGGYAGNIDYIRFVGLKQDAIDTTTNLYGDVTVIGNGTVTTNARQNRSGSSLTFTAVDGTGAVFDGWLVDGERSFSQTLTLDTPGDRQITACFRDYGTPAQNALVEGEGYIWGASNESRNWNGVKNGNGISHRIIDNTRNGDVFYLGKADLTGLTAIAPYITRGNGNAVSYDFYIDMDVDTAQLSLSAGDKYTNASAAVTGGTLISHVVIGQTDNNAWTTFRSFTGTVSGVSGVHDVYMKINATDWGGGIDYVRFIGLEPDAFLPRFSTLVGSAEVEGCGKLTTATGLTPGGTTTLVATPDEGAEFLGIEVNGGARTTDLTVAVDGQTAVKAYFTRLVSITFVGKYGETIAVKSATSAAELANILTNTTATALGGYAFTGWSENPADAEQLFDAGNDITVTAVYEQEPAAKGYHLTVGAGVTAKDGLGSAVDSSTDLSFDQRITVTAEGDVAYWVLDGAKVGFGKNSYTFYVSGDNDIAAVLTADAETVTPAVVLQQAIGTQGSETFTLTVIAQTSIPAGNSVSEYGVIFTSKVPTTAFLSDPASAVVKVKSSKTGANQQYMAHLLNVKTDRTRYARAYAIVDGVTVYSDTAVQFKTAASGVTTDIRAVA
jgi:hypothetical protein